MWILIAGSFTLILFAAGYVLLSARSNTRILNAERSKLEEVSRSEQKYRNLFENSLAGILRFSLEGGKVLDSNQARRSMLRCSSNEELESLVTLAIPGVVQHIVEVLSREGVLDQYEFQTTRKDGQRIWVLMSARVVDENRNVEAILLDITERKLSEDKIREQSALLDQAEIAFIVIDMDGVVRYWNSGGELIYGWTAAETCGRMIGELVYTETERPAFYSAFADVCQYNEWRGEQLQSRKDGKEILVEGRWRTIRNATDDQQYVLIVAADVTEKKKIEAQMSRAQRMETIAVLTSGLAHDLQNVLTPVKMSANLLKKRIADESNSRLVGAILERARTGLDLLRNVLVYGRGTDVRKKRVELKWVLRDALASVKRSSPKGIAYILETKAQRWKVLGDSTQLKQAFTNLLLNARDAVARDGFIKVEADDIVLDDGQGEAYQVEPGPYVAVKVSDSGKGIPQGDLEKIFEPFYTTKERTGGTGLGLSIVHGIIAGHKGFVQVTSRPGKGTTFRVYLPASVSKKTTQMEKRT